MKGLLKSAQVLLATALISTGMGCSGGSSSSPVAVDTQSAKAGQEVLPQVVIDAVNQAMPDGTIVAATREKENGTTVYEVEVVVDGQSFEVEVDTEGRVLEIEEGDDDDDDEDGEDDDDDDEEGDDDDGDEGEEEVEVSVP